MDSMGKTLWDLMQLLRFGLSLHLASDQAQRCRLPAHLYDFS